MGKKRRSTFVQEMRYNEAKALRASNNAQRKLRSGMRSIEESYKKINDEWKSYMANMTQSLNELGIDTTYRYIQTLVNNLEEEKSKVVMELSNLDLSTDSDKTLEEQEQLMREYNIKIATYNDAIMQLNSSLDFNLVIKFKEQLIDKLPKNDDERKAVLDEVTKILGESKKNFMNPNTMESNISLILEDEEKTKYLTGLLLSFIMYGKNHDTYSYSIVNMQMNLSNAKQEKESELKEVLKENLLKLYETFVN